MRACIIPQDVAIVGRHNRTLAIAAGDKFGMVVTPDGLYTAVSYSHDGKLRVYRIEAGGALTLLRTFGGNCAGLKAPSFCASTAWACKSSAQACDNVSVSLLYSVVITALHAWLAGILC